MKLIGALLILLTGVGIGLTARHTLERRITVLSQFERLLQRLGDTIRFQALPVADALRTLADSAEFASCRWLTETAEQVAADGEFRAAWHATVKRYDREWSLSEGERALFDGFADGLGTSDVDGEVRFCEQYGAQIGACLAQRREEANTRRRLYVALGICGGSAVALLLL